MNNFFKKEEQNPLALIPQAVAESQKAGISDETIKKILEFCASDESGLLTL